MQNNSLSVEYPLQFKVILKPNWLLWMFKTHFCYFNPGNKVISRLCQCLKTHITSLSLKWTDSRTDFNVSQESFCLCVNSYLLSFCISLCRFLGVLSEMMIVSCESDEWRDDGWDCSGETTVETHSNRDRRRKQNIKHSSFKPVLYLMNNVMLHTT